MDVGAFEHFLYLCLFAVEAVVVRTPTKRRVQRSQKVRSKSQMHPPHTRARCADRHVFAVMTRYANHTAVL